MKTWVTLLIVLGVIVVSIIYVSKLPNHNKVVEPIMLAIEPGHHFRQCAGGECICHKYLGGTTTVAIHTVYYDLNPEWHRWEPVGCRTVDDIFFKATTT